MVLQEKRILCNVKEPDKNHLWLRPRLDRDGYDLLYWGAEGWTPLIDCEGCPFKKPDTPHTTPDDVKKDIVVNGDILVSIPDGPIEGVEGTLYEITPPDYGPSPVKKSSCGCPDVNN